MTETFHSTDASFGADAVMNSDAEKILQEASAVAEQQSGDRFPSIPNHGIRSFRITFYVSDFRCYTIGSKLQLQGET